KDAVLVVSDKGPDLDRVPAARDPRCLSEPFLRTLRRTKTPITTAAKTPIGIRKSPLSFTAPGAPPFPPPPPGPPNTWSDTEEVALAPEPSVTEHVAVLVPAVA